MSVIVPSKTIQTAMLAWQDIATGSQVISSVVDCSSIWAASFGVRIGRQSATAFTAGWPNIRFEASYLSSGNAAWIPLFTLQPPIGATVGKTTLNGAVSAGASTLTLTSATNFVQGDIIYVGDSSTANYEIVRCKSIASTTVTFEEVCTYAHTNSAIVSNQAFLACPSADLTSYKRVRCVADNANGGITISIEVALITMDSFG